MKKLVKPIVFKRAIRNLIEYLDASNGISDQDEWREEWEEEVKAVSLNIDSADIGAFNKIVQKLDILGVAYGDAFEAFDMETQLFTQSAEKILNKIKW